MSVPARHTVLLLALAPLGCASLAKQPPTPARDIPLVAAIQAQSPPGERYFLLVFGSESRPKKAKFTHTWATMVRVNEVENGPPAIEQLTISWMPATLEIRPGSFNVEPGGNLELAFTIEEMLRHDEHIAVWGPYEVGPVFYQRFILQKQFLESGAVGYQCIDTVGEAARTGNGCDCIHAITDMDPIFDRGRYPLSYFGEAASRHIVKQLHRRPTIIGPAQCHDWLIPLLGLDRYPIERQIWNGPVVENTPANVERYLNSHPSRQNRCR
ncbi:MAG TPA: hypothetical protein VLM40_08895 [Gemmata sp.]|nr:hypothetical protein [Gemmata sp.]